MRFRVLTPGASEAYRSILARTSAEDRYFRYLRAVNGWEPALVDRFGDDVSRVALVAEEGDTPLGLAHAADVDERTAEIAVIVANDARRRGVARGLLSALITYLRSRGYVRFIAMSLRENEAFAKLATASGFAVTGVDGALVFWGLETAAEPALAV